jgi:hypothetical protein
MFVAVSRKYPILPFLFRPYIRRELPGWGKLFHWLKLGGINNVNPHWRSAPTYTARGKWHGYRMKLDLRDDLDRSTYFLGRYYDSNVQLLLDRLLKPGDTLLDVGANVGSTTLHGAASGSSSRGKLSDRRAAGDISRVKARDPTPPR